LSKNAELRKNFCETFREQFLRVRSVWIYRLESKLLFTFGFWSFKVSEYRSLWVGVEYNYWTHSCLIQTKRAGLMHRERSLWIDVRKIGNYNLPILNLVIVLRTV
jgi:hypothetical protein